MKLSPGYVLTINGGSSSVKFAIYQTGSSLKSLLSGVLANVGTAHAQLNFKKLEHCQEESVPVKYDTSEEAYHFLIEWLEKQEGFNKVVAVGHRVVHGMTHHKPEKITPELMDQLNEISSYDPEHLPEEIRLMELLRKRYPTWVHIACFDTAFHATMPPVAKLLTIPRRFNKAGIRRYGFHGLSYSYLMEELGIIAGNKTAKGRVLLAHLGNGASLAAVKNGKSMDTSMGFTPTSGIPMSTRTGDLDPGVAAYLMQHEKLSPHRFNQLINHESGLLGISETSSDMRELLKSKASDSRAAEAIELFCYQTKKFIGAYTAVLGGLDTLVFSGGIGEHTPEVRKLICQDLQCLGIELDQKRNLKNEAIISKDTGKVTVRVMSTNEELMIARLVCRVLNDQIK